MQKFILLLLLITSVTGCNKPQPKPTFEPTPSVLPYTQCGWVWATQPLPELTSQVEAAMRAARLQDVTVIAEAYGENCNDAQTGKTNRFATLETDFRITVKVADLKDKDDLGKTLEKILGVLDAFPTGKVPGPEPGYISVSFRAGSDEMNLMFNVTAAKSAREQGNHGAALLEVLLVK